MSYQIPDLPKLVGEPFQLRTNRHCRAVSEASQAWAEQQAFLDEDELQALPKTRLGLLASLCFTTCDVNQLRVATDFLTVLLHWWDRGVQDEKGQDAFRSVWTQLSRTTSRAWQLRFQRYLDEFGDAGMNFAEDPDANMTLDNYMSWSRRASGFIMGLALIEYVEDLKLPDDVFDSPVISKLRQDTLDLVIWMHDIASYNVQQAANHHYNAVAVMMSEHHITVQTAMNRAGERVKALVDDFLAEEKKLASSSWGPYVDRDVRMYVVSLRDWIVGTAHRIYQCDRYFQGKGDNVKAFRWVFLLPKKAEDEDTEL